MKGSTGKLGAARLYNAVKTNNVSLVLLYLTSESGGKFHYQKVFESWVAGGKNPEMLGALLQYQPFTQSDWRRTRRGTKHFNNNNFNFFLHVINAITPHTPPSTEQTAYLLECVKQMRGVDKHLNSSNLSSLLRSTLEKDYETGWPWAIAAANRGLGFDLATNRYDTETKCIDAIDWFLDHHGPVTADDVKNYTSDINRLDERLNLLIRLIPDPVLQKKIFVKYPFSGIKDSAISGHSTYLQLQQIMPWVLEQEETDEA